jgi:hypothetical protein
MRMATAPTAAPARRSLGAPPAGFGDGCREHRQRDYVDVAPDRQRRRHHQQGLCPKLNGLSGKYASAACCSIARWILIGVVAAIDIRLTH